MARSYSPSQTEIYEAEVVGCRIDTSTLVCTTTIFKQTVVGLFNVFGRIRIALLCGEVIGTAFSADAAKGHFSFTSTSPSIAIAAMSADSAVVTSMAIGQRLTMQGDLVGTACVITASAGISFAPLGKLVVGTNGGIGVISLDNTGAAVTVGTGSMYFTLSYTPLSDDAYVTAAL
jgi:hypothetical protein